MPETDQMPIITGYTIQGAAGHMSMSGLADHDVQATAWAALGTVTAARWDRLELRQRRAGEFELEGFSGCDRRSGIYILTLSSRAERSPRRARSTRQDHDQRGCESANARAPTASSARELGGVDTRGGDGAHPV